MKDTTFQARWSAIAARSRALLVLVWIITLFAVGCSQQTETTTAPAGTDTPREAVEAASPSTDAAVTPSAEQVAEEGTASPSPVPAEATEEAAASPSPASGETPQATAVPDDHFVNPVFRQNFPDPHIIRVDDAFYAFATNGSGRNVQTARSTDLVDWEMLRDAMPAFGRWVSLNRSDVWAPEVIEIDGNYVLYYTARDAESMRQCIGVAVSDQPEGRYTDPHDQPLVCQVEEGGSIDASPYRSEDGTLYLYWKNDGNCCGFATWIYVQELSPDGLSLVGEPERLTRNDTRWEGAVVEAPTMWKQDDDYVLFYSGNGYAGLDYAVGYATCESPTGPCEEAPENPILSTSLERPPVIGPGHQTVVTDDEGQTWMVYHAWEISSAGTRTDRRFMWIDRLEWENGTPVVQGPTTDPQPAPVIDN